MFKIIFLPLIILAGCDKLKISRKKDKVFPMSVGNFEEEVTLMTLVRKNRVKRINRFSFYSSSVR